MTSHRACNNCKLLFNQKTLASHHPTSCLLPASWLCQRGKSGDGPGIGISWRVTIRIRIIFSSYNFFGSNSGIQRIKYTPIDIDMRVGVTAMHPCRIKLKVGTKREKFNTLQKLVIYTHYMPGIGQNILSVTWRECLVAVFIQSIPPKCSDSYALMILVSLIMVTAPQEEDKLAGKGTKHGTKSITLCKRKICCVGG